MRTLLVTLTMCLLVLPVQAKYGGGSGTAQDPYQIATAADLILLGETPADYDKHFLLTADIDLDPNLPGRKVFDRAVIAPKPSWEGGTSFSGVFDGDGHTIWHLTIKGKDYVGLFGQLGDWLSSIGEVKNLGMVDVNIAGSGGSVGGLVGYNYGAVTRCYSTGAVSGYWSVGGLVGRNGSDLSLGTVTRCYSTGVVSGNDDVGGLVGHNDGGNVTDCYGAGAVSGKEGIGGLVGSNNGTVTQCYSTGVVNGDRRVGGLVGANGGAVTQCYSTGAVSGTGSLVGGLMGSNYQQLPNVGNVTASFWDTQTSDQAQSAGGTGLTTDQMKAIPTYLDAGWDFIGETENGTSQSWQMPQGGGYPVLAVFNGYTAPRLQGLGTSDDPYLISDATELGAIIHYSPNTHYRLAADIDLSGVRWSTAVIPSLAGTFDGNSHTISHLTITGGSYVGLFGRLGDGAHVKNLGVVDVNITGSGDYVGGLVGKNRVGGSLTNCHSTGTVVGALDVGGLVGGNSGVVTRCYSTAVVSGDYAAGGLVGINASIWSTPRVDQCYSTGAVSGKYGVGGLVGSNGGTVTECYSAGAVTGDWGVGGLVGEVDVDGWVNQCYSTGAVSGTSNVGGLVGWGWSGDVTASFWDIQTSGQGKSAGGTGETTAQMQTAKTFLEAGWDFVGETANGTEDLWWILEGKDYPRVWWEAHN